MDELVDYGYDHTDGQLIWNLPDGTFSDNGLSDFRLPVGSVREALSPDPARKSFPDLQMFDVGGVPAASKVTCALGEFLPFSSRGFLRLVEFSYFFVQPGSFSSSRSRA
jgi:hypothetical protein